MARMKMLLELFSSVVFCLNFPLYDSFVQDTMSGGNKNVNMARIQKDVAQQEEDVSVQWPDGIVRYYVDNRTYDFIFDIVLKSAIRLIHSRSCVIFKKMPSKPMDNMSWIHITNPRKERECNHGPRSLDNREIELVFGYDCLQTKEILHTLLHGIGFKDEVTHPHRDKYLRVLWNNIHPGFQHLYRKQVLKSSKNLVEYDPLSVMHFHDRAFSRNGRATVVPLEPGFIISPSETLSQLDIMRLQMYFGNECNKRKVSELMQTCKNSIKGREVLKENVDYAVENEKHTMTKKRQKDTLNVENGEIYENENINTPMEVYDTENDDLDGTGQDLGDGERQDSEMIEVENKENEKEHLFKEQIEGQGRVRLDSEESENHNKEQTIGELYEKNYDSKDIDSKNYGEGQLKVQLREREKSVWKRNNRKYH